MIINEERYVKRKRMRETDGNKQEENDQRKVKVLKKIKGRVDWELKERCVELGEFKRRLVGCLDNFRKRNRIVFSTVQKDKTLSIFYTAESKENNVNDNNIEEDRTKNNNKDKYQNDHRISKSGLSLVKQSETRKIPFYTIPFQTQSLFQNHSHTKDNYNILILILITWFTFILVLYFSLPSKLTII